jgi:NAD(P)H-nitrite reductase large subunit
VDSKSASQKKSVDNVTCAVEIKPDDQNLIICRCEEVSRADILVAISEGCRTVEEIKRRTRAGMGLCQSKSCLRSVQRILAEQTGQKIAEIYPTTFRSPVRPVSLGVLAALELDERFAEEEIK